jgi:hypothetical protein
VNNSTFGTLSNSPAFVNNTGGPVTRLRFRVIDISTFPAPVRRRGSEGRGTSVAVVVPGIGDSTNVPQHGRAPRRRRAQ